MSDIDPYLHLFKADWVAKPELLKKRLRDAKVNDFFTAEIAAWCAEVHEHLRDLEEELGIRLILMGGNGASLRFDAVKQRGSRDNDYLTVATPDDIERLMRHFGDRFAQVPGLMEPERYTERWDQHSHQ